MHQRSLFVRRVAPPFAAARTERTVSHFESLLFASSYSPVSKFKMAALCTSVCVCVFFSFCGSCIPLPSHNPPPLPPPRSPTSVSVFSLDAFCGGLLHAELRSFVGSGGRGAELDAQAEATTGATLLPAGCALAHRLHSAARHHSPSLSPAPRVITRRYSRTLCPPTPFVVVSPTCCPKDEPQTLSEDTRRLHGKDLVFSPRTRACGCCVFLCHQKLSCCCLFSTADLSRWIKCSPTGLKSQI